MKKIFTGGAIGVMLGVTSCGLAPVHQSASIAIFFLTLGTIFFQGSLLMLVLAGLVWLASGIFVQDLTPAH